MSGTINMSTIHSFVQKTLFEKMSMLEKTTSVSPREKKGDGVTTTNYKIGSPLTTEIGIPQNYMMARTTWMRMVSMKLDPDGKPVILQGGEVDKKGRFVSNLWGSKIGTTSTPGGGEVNPGEPITTPEKLQHGRYWAAGETQPFRPFPGLKDIRVEHRSMRQTAIAPTRTTDINWICWTWQDLDRLIKHFLTPTAGVFVDWGWMGGKDTVLYNVVPYPLFEYDDDDNIKSWNFNVNKIENCLSMHIINQMGHYDAIIGQVYNFDWKVRDDGGFDCTTQIIGKGSLILDTLNTIGTNHLKARLPDIIRSHDEEKYYKSTTNVKETEGSNYSFGRITKNRVVEEKVWILPVFAAEKFFKADTSGYYKDILDKITQSKLKTLVYAKDINGEPGTGTPSGTELLWDPIITADDKKPTDWGGQTVVLETKKTIDLTQGAELVSTVGMPIENSEGYDQEFGGYIKKSMERKFLYIKSPELLRALSPWITFDDYMNDIWNQVFHQMKNNAGFISSGNVIGIFGNESQHIYVTWGWFEDNVLSRFFGQIRTPATTGGIIVPGIFTEFRSYEDDTSGKGQGSGTYTVKSGEGLSVLAQKFNMSMDDLIDMNQGLIKTWGNNKGFNEGAVINIKTDAGSGLDETGKKLCMTPAGQYVFTTDTSKFLIVDKGSKTAEWVRNNWGTGWGRDPGRAGSGASYHNKKVADMLGVLKTFDDEAEHVEPAWFASIPFGKVEDNKIPAKSKINLKYFQDPNNPTEKNAKKSGIIRNVYFNVEFLRETMTEQPSIGTAILKVWQEFSNEYGGIFRFGLEHNTTGGRTMVKSKTWTEGSVVGMLSNKSHRMDPNALEGRPESVDNFDGLFEFPTWKAGSMVKSQNLTATLPSALKKQLSLQISNPNPEDVEKSDDQQKVNEAKGVIKLSMPDYKSPGPVGLKPPNYTKDGLKEKAMTDALSGTVDFPYRNNRWFGSNSADIKTPISIGIPDEGIKITDTLLESLIRDESFKYFNLVNQAGGDEKDGVVGQLGLSAEAKNIIRQKNELMKKFLSDIKDEKGLSIGGDSKFYNRIGSDAEDKESKGWRGSYWRLDSSVRGELNGLLKGPNGPAGLEDPLVPIDFDMDIDGIGGIFPGNAFASNYLPTRYREQSCFQTTGVEQRVDSSNWTTTIKGQIRVTLKLDWDPGMTVDDYFTMQGLNPLSGIRFKLPLFPEGEFDEDLEDIDIVDIDPVKYSELEEPPPYVRPVVEVPEVVDVSALEATIGGEAVTQAQIDAAMAAATERFTAAEVEVITRVQALQTFQNTLLSTLPAEFSWDTFLPVFDAITNSAAAVGDPIAQSFAELDMSLALNSLYGISRITAGQVNIDGTTRAQYRIQFHSGESTVGP